ncbi:cryptochrome/photolyase family protein [Listeria ivanovii]|uniref:Deoxyribodipyrimidine photo-lyase n=1 Tax=Listeria ivanovii (strain ATCC BAA-678 / PAM 55) TaxID=881621 RepID=G2ZBX6_LISIP|nr:deoxyribodipyrimidine photo-lyase [Listeria ivanovii]AHI55103.1 deoxyribodipyrimidine photolyase [Listeria ivanovii WSLC3009]AIS64562.1 deoxyribodipyrimidine photolyase [Listeria ivanovii subsp. ivanovii]MBC1758767.1 deoxyribodipyrimidine photo-lyase [Listeria ivanovii]MBK3913625.1 deoxyribodipyrimidine photo-lyase [Listeria ivanovii subsp. ivanovii]MBK3920257.1 deoxyribodipyrimidine photo-lyase [Listeria ivanovii subsp. ivanovii]
MTSIIWFRRDLRLNDNKALYEACKDKDDLILLFQVNPEQFIKGSPNHQAFFSSVAHFKQKLDKLAHLQIMFGEPISLFKKLKEQVPSWDKVYFNRDETGNGSKRDEAACQFFTEEGINIHAFYDTYLHHADEVKKSSSKYYKIFTPYYKKWQEEIKELPLHVKLNPAKIEKESLFPEDEKRFARMTQDFSEVDATILGEKAAQTRLATFIKEDLAQYNKVRDYPNLDRTSHLSRFLRTGELSIRTVWQAVQGAELTDGRATFEKELCWRDFYNMIYVSFPNQKNEAIQTNYRFIEWENNRNYFQKWQQGATGYPLVDAAMRQLKETGWMHNRLRMITASFLTKDLLIDWRWGEKYFEQMLIDYDPASNIGGWQWAASTGTDAVPYFRIFNPTTQSEKFDPSGNFIRKYVQELAGVPNKFIHQPEKMTVKEQTEFKLILGEDYSFPIVDHQERRKAAIARYEFSKTYASQNL